MDSEEVDIINDSGIVIKQALKTESHKQGWLHKTVIGYLKYGDDWALVRQAEDRQDPGKLVAPVGGHVQAGETVETALRRESKEEIGTGNIKFKHVGDAVYYREVLGRKENHLFVVYEIKTEDKIKLGSEAVAIERYSSLELKEALKEHPKDFGLSYYFVLEYFYPEYLPKEYKHKYKLG